MKIYLQQDHASAGPFDEAVVREQLRQGSLSPAVYAWREGMADWLPLDQILAGPLPIPPPSLAAVSPVSMTARPGMPWWGKLLLGCGGLAVLAVIVVVGFFGWVVYKSEHPNISPMSTQHVETDRDRAYDAKLDKEIAEAEAQMKKEQADIDEQIKTADADPAHYDVVKKVSMEGGTIVTVTPKAGAPNPRPITKRVDADGKVTITTLEANGDTVTKSIDTHGNITTVTTPKTS